ncbi:MAG TPA: hypothetical protein VH540_21585 [Ktedonobacterales bacterium]|jgi:hypothetical protein
MQQPISATFTTSRPRRLWKRALLTLGTLWFAFFIVACGTTSVTPKVTATTAPTATSTPGSQTFKVFFTHHPESDNDPTVVFAVERLSPVGKDQPFYALVELFKGPTADERTTGYYSPFDAQMGLISYCSGDFKDFTLAMDQRGTIPEPGTATVTFCRTVTIPGELAGGRMQAVVNATLLQFSEVKKVVLLTHEGECFNDLRGDNQCLSR